MPVKNTHAKKTRAKKITPPVRQQDHNEEEKEDVPQAVPVKARVAIEIDLHDPLVPEERTDEPDPLAPEEETEELESEESGLEEELDPFGDKYEG